MKTFIDLDKGFAFGMATVKEIREKGLIPKELVEVEL